MNCTSKLAAFLKILPLLLMLGGFALWTGGSSYAQAPEPTDANGPAPAAQGALPPPVFDPSEPNAFHPGAPRDYAAARPDLVITDPDADVIAEIERLTSASAGNILAIPAAAFVPDGSERQWYFGFNNAYLYPAGAGLYCGIAPVYLPNGVTITGVISYVYDNNGSSDTFTELYAKPIGLTTVATSMARIDTSGQSTNIQSLVDLSIMQPVINNSSYTYHLGVCLWSTDSTTRFYAAQILY